jgi:hypothetical protein
MSFQKYFPIDKDTIFRERAQAAVTATGYVGTQKDLKAAVLTEMVMVINVEAIDLASTNEVYTFRVVGSNVADRSDGTVLGMAQLGHAATITIETVNTAAGDRIEIRFSTEKDGVNYRYLDLHLTAAGTTPSITFNAFASKRM